jgi:hypothetical protein
LSQKGLGWNSVWGGAPAAAAAAVVVAAVAAPPSGVWVVLHCTCMVVGERSVSGGGVVISSLLCVQEGGQAWRLPGQVGVLASEASA